MSRTIGQVILWIGLVGLNGALLWSRDPHLAQTTIEGVHTETRLIVLPGGRIAVEILRPRQTAQDLPRGPRPALLLIHGGSWRGGSAALGTRGVESTAERLAQAGIVVVAVDYTLARPGAPSWPMVMRDLRSTLRWIRREARTLDVDPDRIGVLGFGAGGHLAALLGTMPDELDQGVSSKPGVVVDFYGPTDLAGLERDRNLEHDPIAVFLGAGDRHVASPLEHVSADDPPHLILHGTADLWTPIEQSQRLAARLEGLGVRVRLIEVQGARHGFEAGVEFPRHLDLLPEILAFLKSVWNAP